MDDQEAKQIIDSQQGQTINERERNAQNLLENETHLAENEFYRTLTKLTDYYTDGTRAFEGINIHDFRLAARAFADRGEYAEAVKMLRNDEYHFGKAVTRSQALADYVRRQKEAVRA